MNQQQIRGYKIMDQWSARQSSGNRRAKRKQIIFKLKVV